MEGIELLAPAVSRRAQVDAVLDRFFSLTSKPTAPLGPECVAMQKAGWRPRADTVLRRVT